MTISQTSPHSLSEGLSALVPRFGPPVENGGPSGGYYPLVNIQKNYGKSPCLMGKSTISMAIFNSKLLVYQRVNTFKTLLGWGCSSPVSKKWWEIPNRTSTGKRVDSAWASWKICVAIRIVRCRLGKNNMVEITHLAQYLLWNAMASISALSWTFYYIYNMYGDGSKPGTPGEHQNSW